MIVNRVGDFGILMSVFLIFWTFGTLNFYSPGETANVCYALEVNHLGECEKKGEHGADEGEGTAVVPAEGETTETATTDEHSETETTAEGDHSETAATTDEHGAAEAGAEHGEEAEGDHGEGHAAVVLEDIDNSQFEPKQLGVFGQTKYYMELPEGDAGRMIDFGPFSLDFGQVLFLILIFMLLGVAGKSAQIPLFIWLPDAMAGPTPVSALMHAATMVTAGVFLLVRSNVFLDYAPEARFVIAIIGASTALLAGYIAIGQWDIKRVLAYSTISQLGFMVAAVGLGAYVAAIFHLATHAVFKALLFLGSGSVIHGVEHGHHHVHGHGHGHDSHDDHHDDHAAHHDDFDPQDMRNMGGLGNRMPLTYITYLFGTFALAGLPFFAGFWSKDEILADAWHVGFDEGHLEGYIVLGLLLAAAACTAFYMWRQVQMVFHGQPRSEGAANAPESSAWMVIPLLILAFFSFTIGFMNVPTNGPFHGFFGWKDYEFKHFLEASMPSLTGKTPLEFNWLLAIGAVALAFAAIAFAHSRYAGDKSLENREDPNIANRLDPLYANRATRQIWSIANARMYWDEIYGALIEQPYNRLADFFANVVDWRFLHDYFHDTVLKKGYDSLGGLLARPFDLGIIDGAVNGVGWLVRFFSGRMRGLQTGYVRTYAVILLFGVVLVIVLTLLPLIQARAGQ
jgi:NADH-quinone oxidoreductase subunit L